MPTRIYSNFMFAVYMIILKLKLKYNVKLKYISIMAEKKPKLVGPLVNKLLSDSFKRKKNGLN